MDCLKSVIKQKDGICQKEVQPNYSECIEEFKKNITILHNSVKMPITNKMHIIIDHVGDYITMSNSGLGKFSDQGVEAMHQRLNQCMSTSR